MLYPWPRSCQMGTQGLSFLSVTVSSTPQEAQVDIMGPRSQMGRWRGPKALEQKLGHLASSDPPAVPSRSSATSEQIHLLRLGLKHVPGCLPPGPVGHFNNRRRGKGPHVQEGGGVAPPPGASAQRVDRTQGREAQWREAKEGFLEEGSPPPKLEEHTVQTRGGAPSRL